HTPRADGFGMHGSGIFIINPPYVLPDLLRDVLPELTRLLAQDSGAKFELDYCIA
ncbi:23S rRNA (adenine(2030)-N(6))-methyltransferase RlmJ, partial [Kingella kingae]